MPERVRSVLFVTTSFPRFAEDFAGSFVFRFAKYLVKDGVQVTVLAPGAVGYPAIDDIAGVRIHRFRYFYPARLQCLAYERGGMLSNIRQTWLARVQIPCFFLAMLWTILRHQSRYDLIHCHWLPTAIAALVARVFRSTKPPIIFTNWGSDTRLLPSWLTRWTVTRVEGCLSTAVETDEHLLAAGRTAFRRVMAPIDEERFTHTSASPDLRHELGLNTHTPILAFIGRLDPFKDPLTFIHACAVLQTRGMPFFALIAGDGVLMSACQQAIHKHALHEQVLLLGTVSYPERILRVATAFVHISPVENTWANAIAEAMFMDVPVVLSDAGYTKRLFTHDKDCLMVPAQDAGALAHAMQRLVNDSTLQQRLASGGRDLLRQHQKDRASIVHAMRSYYDEIYHQGAQQPYHAERHAGQ